MIAISTYTLIAIQTWVLTALIDVPKTVSGFRDVPHIKDQHQRLLRQHQTQSLGNVSPVIYEEMYEMKQNRAA
jgi:hypothetical protein